MKKAKFLFFFVHPSKYHLFKFLIRHLIAKGFHVDIAIVTKDILEDLIKKEGWSYTNIFPEGRRISAIPILLATVINFFRTFWRLVKFTSGKKHDYFLSDDVLSIIGWLKGVKSYHFQDDDYNAVPESALLLSTANFTFAPDTTDLGQFNSKKISYNSLHELAYLHPNRFSPKREILEKYGLNGKKYFVLRLVSLTASHDVGKKGLNNELVQSLINILQKNGEILITAERKLPQEFEKYRMNISPEDISNVIYFSDMFIGDSQTMATEAAVMGVPSLRCNSFVGKISSMEELEKKYKISWGFLPEDFEKLIEKVEELLSKEDLKLVLKGKRKKMLEDKVDLSTFMINYFEKIALL